MTHVIEKVVDRRDMFEIIPEYANNTVTAFVRMEGRMTVWGAIP